ncbi:hypothetical protein HDU93_009997, partial [Gonapodya sp. JEL0774]
TWIASPAFVLSLDHVRSAITALDQFTTLYGLEQLLELAFSGWSFLLGIAFIPLLFTLKEALRCRNLSSSEPEPVLIQLLDQTRRHVSTVTVALKSTGAVRAAGRFFDLKYSHLRGDLSFIPWRKYPSAAARLIERLHNLILNQDVSSGIGDPVVEWVADKSASVVWRMFAVTTGTSSSSLLSLNVGSDLENALVMGDVASDYADRAIGVEVVDTSLEIIRAELTLIPQVD